jgi:hypothetical protein
VATKYILAALSVVFLGLAAARGAGVASGTGGPARTWLVIGVTFAAVSTWLFITE